MSKIERGKLIYEVTSKTTEFIIKIFGIGFGILLLFLIPWIWINIEGNINPLTWSKEEWILALLAGILYGMIIAGIFGDLRVQSIRLYENGFCPRIRPLRYAFKRKEVFIPWDDILYMKYYENKNESLGDPSNYVKGYDIYYKLNGRIWYIFIGNYKGWWYLGKEYEAKVLGKLHDVYNKLKAEGKLLPEKPKKFQVET